MLQVDLLVFHNSRGLVSKIFCQRSSCMFQSHIYSAKTWNVKEQFDNSIQTTTLFQIFPIFMRIFQLLIRQHHHMKTA